MNFGIIVEGDDDVAVYPVLIKRIDNSVDHVHYRKCEGRRKLKNKFVPFIKEFEQNPAAFGIQKIIVIRDSDCNEPGPLEAELQHILRDSGLAPRIPVSFHATKCKLESWLLADENAINLISQTRRGRGGLAAIPGNLENTKDADEVYDRALRQVGLLNTDVVMKEIAQKTDLSIIARRCPRFRDFTRKVTDR